MDDRELNLLSFELVMYVLQKIMLGAVKRCNIIGKYAWKQRLPVSNLAALYCSSLTWRHMVYMYVNNRSLTTEYQKNNMSTIK